MPLIAAYSCGRIQDQGYIMHRVMHELSAQGFHNTRLFYAVIVEAPGRFFPKQSDVTYTCLMTNDVCLELKKEIMERVRNQLKQKEDAKIQELLAEIATLKTAIKSMENEHARSSKRVSHLEEENTKLAEANSELLRKLNLYEESEWEELSSFVESSCA